MSIAWSQAFRSFRNFWLKSALSGILASRGSRHAATLLARGRVGTNGCVLSRRAFTIARRSLAVTYQQTDAARRQSTAIQPETRKVNIGTVHLLEAAAEETRVVSAGRYRLVPLGRGSDLLKGGRLGERRR